MRGSAAVPLALFAGGLVLITEAVLHGGADAYWAWVVLVLTGASLEFALGIVLLLAGFLTLPLLWAGAFRAPEEPPPEAVEPAPEGEEATVIVIGPLPVFVGVWRRATTELRWLALVALSVLALVLVALLLWY